MPDEIDYDAFMPKAPVPVAPLPEVDPAPVTPSGGMDYDSFMPGRPGAQSPGFNMAQFLGPAPAEPTGPIQTQTDTTPAITPAQDSDFKATKIWRALELERQDMQANPEATIGSDGGPAPATSNYMDKYPVSKALAGAPSATFAQLQNSLRESAGLAQGLPVQGLGSQFASGLGSGLQKLGSGLGYGGPSPDDVDAADRAANANFATPKPGWDSVAGWRDQAGQAANSLGATTPMLLGLMATRGRTLPMMGPMVGIGAEAGAANFAYNAAADPHMTPQQNLAESVIEGIMTPLGGKFEPGFAKTPLAKVPVRAFGEKLEEGLTSGLQSVSGQRLDPNGDGSVNWRQVGNETTVGSMAGGAASVGLSGPGAAKDALVNRIKLDLAAMQTPYSQQEHTVPLPPPPPKFQPGEFKRLEALWNNLGVRDPSARIDQRTLESTPTAPITTDTTAGYQDPNGPQRPYDEDTAEDPLSGFDPEQIGDLARLDGGQETVAAEAVQEARAQQDTAPDIAPVNPGVQGREQRSAAKTQVFTPEQLASQKSEVQAANNDKIHQEYLDRQAAQQDEAPVRPASPKTAETQVDIAPVRPTPVAKPSQGKLDFQAAPEQGPAQPSPAQPSPAKQGQDRIDFATKQPDGPAPIAPAAKAPLDLGPLVEPAPDKQRITPAPRPRGTAKLPELVRKHLGAKGFARKVPSSMTPDRVRLFKDASHHDMEVSEPKNGLAIAYDKYRNVAVVVVRTDSKGRKNPNGTEWRALAADDKESWASYVGEPGVTLHKGAGGKSPLELAGLELVQRADINLAPRTSTPEGSQSDGGPTRISRNTPAPKAAETDEAAPRSVEAAGRAQEIADLQKELAPLSARATSRTNPLTDEEVARAEALEDEIVRRKEANAKADKAEREAKAAPAPKDQSKADKAKENSPLTPKLRKNFADNFTPDDLASMPPRQVGQLIEQFLTDGLGKKPTQAEVGAAIRDLEGHELLQPGQAVAPGTSVSTGANGGNLFSDPMEQRVVDMAHKALGYDAGRTLENAISDIPLSQSAQVHEIKGPNATRLGHMTSTFVHHVTRALGKVGTGHFGGALESLVARAHLQHSADWIARKFPAFRPVLAAVRDQMDETKRAKHEAYIALDPLKALDGASRKRADGALITFRLEDRAAADHDKPVNYTDEMGRTLSYTLSPEELAAVKAVFAANKKLLADQAAVALEALGLPAGLTHKDLVRGLASGLYKPSASMAEDLLRVLETGSDSYVPLMRTGPRVIRVYDQTAYNAAKNEVERKAALLSTSNATTLDQARKAITNATHRFPTAHITSQPSDEMLTFKEETGVSERELLQLAEDAGVTYGVMHQFMAGGVSDYFATRGTKARFVGANKLPGFNHDMYQVNVDHAVKMTNATMALKYGMIQKRAVTAKAIPDKRLRLYATRFIDSTSAPTAPWSGTVNGLVTFAYLSFNLASATVNASSSYIKGVLVPALMGTSPATMATSFAESTKQMVRAGLSVVGRGHLYGDAQAKLAINGWKTKNPGLSKALENSWNAGQLNARYDNDADEIARYGQASAWGKARRAVFDVGMHGFAAVERANRIAASVTGYHLYEQAMASGPARKSVFLKMADHMNLDVSSAEKFMVSYNNSLNFRNDKTESPTLAKGFFDSEGKFGANGLNRVAYGLHSYQVNEMVYQASLARAAWKSGWIPRLTYATMLAGTILAFGAHNMVPGGPAVAKVYQQFTGDLEGLEKVDAEHPGRRILMTGAAGAITEAALGKTAGEYVDNLVSRAGNANAIPTRLGVANLSPAAGLVRDIGMAGVDLYSGIPQRQHRAAALLGGKGIQNLVEYGETQITGKDKLTAKGGVAAPGPLHSKPGAPELQWYDNMAGMLGVTPPVVQLGSEMEALKAAQKAANDHEMDILVYQNLEAMRMKEGPLRDEMEKRAERRLTEWNDAASREGKLYLYITEDSLRQALIARYRAESLGASDLKGFVKPGRADAQKVLDTRVGPENTAKE